MNVKEEIKKIENYAEYMEKSIYNKDKKDVMIGRFDGGATTSYVNKAGTEYKYFNMDDNKWYGLMDEKGYTEPELVQLFIFPFIDEGIKDGAKFYFSHNPTKANCNTSLYLEYEYLLKNGYKWNEENMVMEKI